MFGMYILNTSCGVLPLNCVLESAVIDTSSSACSVTKSQTFHGVLFFCLIHMQFLFSSFIPYSALLWQFIMGIHAYRTNGPYLSNISFQILWFNSSEFLAWITVGNPTYRNTFDRERCVPHLLLKGTNLSYTNCDVNIWPHLFPRGDFILARNVSVYTALDCWLYLNCCFYVHY